MQKGKVAKPHIVEVDLHFRPVELCVIHSEALRLVVDDRDTVDEARSVHTLPELAGEQVDPHDAEDEPEDKTHEQHIHNGGDGSYESVHDHLMSNTLKIKISPTAQSTSLIAAHIFDFFQQFKASQSDCKASSLAPDLIID